MLQYKEFKKNFEKNVLKLKRNIEEIELVAVSKRKSESSILPVIQLGHSAFGENQLQEIEKKWPTIKKQFQNIRLHFVGAIQSRKIVSILNQCDVIHSIDREKIIKIIAQIDKKKLLKKQFFIQVNTGNEPQKSGVKLEDAERFIEVTRNNYKLQVDGLMCIPPENENPDSHFQTLQGLAINNNIKYLSMGMSNDYESALKYGATHIRIGTAIFGTRN
ncbi:YggS family pyridoxal phosphate-dependent enzyme [Pelagibacteraceae bacterium]|nr:YggS family pyridoxal phosphate-dependent enzyme [Pelagibacteraceae bacterium]